MSKKSSFFRQLPVPQLQKIITINQPQKQIIDEHWKHLFSAIEIQIGQKLRSVITVYKSNSFLTLICFQQSWLTYQRKFKIVYSQVYQMTCIKLHPIIVRHKQTKKKEIIVMIGFYDGAVELYHLVVTDKTVVLKKYLSFESIQKQPVTNIVVFRGSMVVSRVHEVQLYNQAITNFVDLMIHEQYNKQSKLINNPIKCSVNTFGLKQMAEGMNVSIFQGKQCIHVYNQSEGSKTFLNETLQQYGSITDSICFMMELIDENIAIGDTNDKLKIIFKKKNIVQRFGGFKNYCSDGCHLVFQAHEQLWVADYYGCITLLTKPLRDEEITQKSPSLQVIDKEVHFSIKLIESGIKKLSICGKMMIVLDTESNIHFFDIVRKEGNHTSKEINVESINEYSSDG